MIKKYNQRSIIIRTNCICNNKLKQKQFKITDNTTNSSELEQVFSNNID